jgi:hypothetical protein
LVSPHQTGFSHVWRADDDCFVEFYGHIAHRSQDEQFLILLGSYQGYVFETDGCIEGF